VLYASCRDSQDVGLLAHRGLWRHRHERNTAAALEAALAAGFGIETDVRDCLGELVISHDMPRGDEATLASLLDCYTRLGSTAPLALNVKSDGLAEAIRVELEFRRIRTAFCFDMSVPDSRSYEALGMRWFARLSEFETPSAITDLAAGIWLDTFESTWFDEDTIELWLARGRDVCLVSPELHGRPYTPLWNLIHHYLSHAAGRHSDPTAPRGRLMLCTDFPQAFAGVAA